MTTHEPDCRGFASARGEAEGFCVDWCYGCMACEPTREGDAGPICGECFHVHRAATNAFTCDVCGHDF
jgi:hypothetical protein